MVCWKYHQDRKQLILKTPFYSRKQLINTFDMLYLSRSRNIFQVLNIPNKPWKHMAALFRQCPSTAAKALWSSCQSPVGPNRQGAPAGQTDTAPAHPTPAAALVSMAIHPALSHQHWPHFRGLRKETLVFLLTDYLEQTILKIGFKSSLSMWLQI